MSGGLKNKYGNQYCSKKSKGQNCTIEKLELKMHLSH